MAGGAFLQLVESLRIREGDDGGEENEGEEGRFHQMSMSAKRIRVKPAEALDKSRVCAILSKVTEREAASRAQPVAFFLAERPTKQS